MNLKQTICLSAVAGVFVGIPFALIGCSSSSDADIASRNMSKAADQIEITRREVFYNVITGDYMLTVEGL